MALPRLRICAQLAHRYSYTGNNNQTLSKEVLLNDTDPLYKRLKHMHIAELSTQLHAEYKALLQSSRTLTLTVTHPHPHPHPHPDPDPDPNPKPHPNPNQARACAALSLPQLVAKWAGASLGLCGAKRLGVAVAA